MSRRHNSPFGYGNGYQPELSSAFQSTVRSEFQRMHNTNNQDFMDEDEELQRVLEESTRGNNNSTSRAPTVTAPHTDEDFDLQDALELSKLENSQPLGEDILRDAVSELRQKRQQFEPPRNNSYAYQPPVPQSPVTSSVSYSEDDERRALEESERLEVERMFREYSNREQQPETNTAHREEEARRAEAEERRRQLEAEERRRRVEMEERMRREEMDRLEALMILERQQQREQQEQQRLIDEQQRVAQLQRQLERDEQDRAYQRSLDQDAEKRRQLLEKQKEEEIAKRIEDEKKMEEERLEQEKLMKEAIRLSRLSEIQQTLPPEPQPGSPDAIQALISLPNGQKISRTFTLKNSIGDLRNFVEVQQLEEFGAAQIPVKFNLVTDFPRTVWQDDKVTLGQTPFRKRQLFRVEADE